MGLNFSGIGLPPISHFSNLNIRLLHGFVEYDTLREKKFVRSEYNALTSG